MLFTSSPAPVATLATEIFQTLATRQACGVAGCAVVRSVVALLPCGGADGCRRVAGRREVVPTPFGHTAVSVLRRITVTLSFLLPHFRRTPHSALVALAVRVANTHTHTQTERLTQTDIPDYPDTAIFGLWQAATSPTFSSSLLWPNLAGAVRTTMSSSSPSSPSPSPSLSSLSPFSLSLLSPRMVSWLGKGVGRGGEVGEGMCAGNVAKNVHLFSEVLLFVLTRVAVNCGKHGAKCLEYL